MNRLNTAFEVTKVSLAVGSSVYLFITNIFVVAPVAGPSMMPTFNEFGDWVAVDLILWRWRPLEFGSLMSFVPPDDPDKIVMKRLIGLPGDNLLIDPTQSSTERITVPKGHVWMQGDNYAASNDSRYYGPVPIGLLRGKILFKFSPFRSN